MSEWQSIETAPKDGTVLLLYYPPVGGAPFDGWIEGWWFSSPKKIDDGWETIIGTVGEPTYWLPNPGEPEAPTE